MMDVSRSAKELEEFRGHYEALRREIARVIVGQEHAVDGVLTALAVGGHVRLEGLPGTGKTRLVRALAGALDLSFQRIQCTPDLMPTDIIGTHVIMETPQGRRTFEFQKGPLFAHLVLADHVNRAMPKTQSALLEAMDEQAVTVATERFPLPRPHMIVATQTPDAEEDFPLPEAQIDRFMFSLAMRPPSVAEMEQILQRTTDRETVQPRPVLDGEQVVRMGEVARAVPVPPEVRRWAVALVAATDPSPSQVPQSPEIVRRSVRHGCGPRAAQALLLGAKVRAILAGRFEVACEDVRAVALPALGHRLVLSHLAQAEGVSPAAILDEITTAVPPPG